LLSKKNPVLSKKKEKKSPVFWRRSLSFSCVVKFSRLLFRMSTFEDHRRPENPWAPSLTQVYNGCEMETTVNSTKSLTK
jgi:hypothetical protein